MTNSIIESEKKLEYFLDQIQKLEKNNNWDKRDLVQLFNETISNFNHIETGRNLDQRM